MAYINVEDSFSINGDKIVVTGITSGDFFIGNEVFLITSNGAVPALIEGIERDRKLFDFCLDGDYAGFSLKMESTFDMDLFNVYVEEFNETHIQAFVTTDASEIDFLSEQIFSHEDITNLIISDLVEHIEEHIDALSLKFKQLTYVDEYKDLETASFVKEATKFIRKKLSYEDGRLEYCAHYLTRYIENFLDGLSEGDTVNPTGNPYDYEDQCAELLKHNNWNITATPKSGDQGADVIADKNGIKIILQCKLYSQPVGNKAVQEVFSAKSYYEATEAYVVSNASYTKSAKELASSLGIKLIHHDQLLSI